MIRSGICGGAMFQSPGAVEYSTDELVYSTVKQALHSASLTIEDIDYVVQNADDALEGIAIQHVYQVEAAGSFLKQETKLEGEPGRAVIYGLRRLQAGLSRCVLVVACGKASQVDVTALELMGTDPYFLRPIEATVTALAGLQASEFLRRTGLTERHLYRSRAIRLGISVEEVESSEPVALPLRRHLLPVYGDLCVALILTTEEEAAKRRQPFTAIQGQGMATASFPFSEFACWNTARKAIEEAVHSEVSENAEEGQSSEKRESAAGRNDTFDDRRLTDRSMYVELVDGWAHHEWMLAEFLGLVDLSNPDLYLNQNRVNTGGFMVYSPPATGAARLLAAHERLTREAQAGKESEALVISSAGLSSVSSFYLRNTLRPFWKSSQSAEKGSAP